MKTNKFQLNNKLNVLQHPTNLFTMFGTDEDWPVEDVGVTAPDLFSGRDTIEFVLPPSSPGTVPPPILVLLPLLFMLLLLLLLLLVTGPLVALIGKWFGTLL